MVSIRQLKYFVEIVDAGSYSAAAARLFIAQSALSRHVKELETLAEVQLLRRNSRQIALTPAGQLFYDGARQILGLLNDTIAQARHAGRGQSGTIRLLHSSSVPLHAPLMRAVDAFLQANAEVRLDISQMSSELQGADVEEERADVGLVRLPTHRQFPGLQVSELYRERLMLAVAPGHRLAREAAVALAQLRDEAFVSMPHGERGGLSFRVVELCRQHGFFPRPARVTSRKTTLLSLVQAGFGIALVPCSMAAIAAPGIVLVPLQDDDCDSVVALIRRQAPCALVDNFVAALRSAGSADGASAAAPAREIAYHGSRIDIPQKS